MNRYLVKIFWKGRKMERYSVEAKSEVSAISGAVSLVSRFQYEPYYIEKSKADFIHKCEIKI